MRRALIIATVALLALAGAVVSGMVAPRTTVAETDATDGSQQISVPVYDLHVRHPNIKTLPVQDAPQP